MDESRVRNIEEAQAFADRRTDDLDEAVRELGERLLELNRRFQNLEQRLEDVMHRQAQVEQGGSEDSDPVDEIPPHSGRLPGGR